MGAWEGRFVVGVWVGFEVVGVRVGVVVVGVRVGVRLGTRDGLVVMGARLGDRVGTLLVGLLLGDEVVGDDVGGTYTHAQSKDRSVSHVCTPWYDHPVPLEIAYPYGPMFWEPCPMSNVPMVHPPQELVPWAL